MIRLNLFRLLGAVAVVGLVGCGGKPNTDATDAQGFPKDKMVMDNGPVTGKPTNYDVHGNMPMKTLAGEDGATMKLANPAMQGLAPREIKMRAAASGQVVPVTQRQASYLQETVLTPQNVGKLQFLYTHWLPNDERLESQPLVFPRVPMPDGNTYDLAVYTTMANTVSAFDFATDHLLWSERIGGNPVSDSPQIDSWNVNQHWGIMSTCAGDPGAFMLYCVSWSDPAGNWQTGKHKFHAIDLRTGAYKTLDLSNVVYNPGNGFKTISFSQSERKQRCSLVMATENGKKTVFVGFGTIAETSANAHGWLVAVDVATFAVTGAFANCAQYSGGGFWQAGGPPTVLPGGDLLLVSGNGSFSPPTDLGESIIRFHYDGSSIKPIHWWSPFSDSGRAGGSATGTHITTDNGGGWDDMDLGSAAPAVFSILNRTMVGFAGKDDIWYVADPDNLGDTKPADFSNTTANFAKLLVPPTLLGFPSPLDKATCTDQPINPISANFTDLNKIYCNHTHHQHSVPVIFYGPGGVTYLYDWSENANLRAFTVAKTGALSYIGCSAEAASVQSPAPPGGMAGGFLSVSANGASNGIVFAAVPYKDANRGVSQGFVSAYAASSFSKYSDGSGSLPLLWKSPQYTYSKFNQIVIDAGRLLVPTYGKNDGENMGGVDVYGLPQ